MFLMNLIWNNTMYVVVIECNLSLFCGGNLSIESKEFLNPELTLH
jgi:hypothetical protein